MRVILFHSISSVELTPHFALSRLSAWFVYACKASTVVFSIVVYVAQKEVFPSSFKAVELVCTSGSFTVELTHNRYCTVKCLFIRELIFLGQ
jgi:hypothetical protein